MAKGGYRPGAGRPKKIRLAPATTEVAVPAKSTTVVDHLGLTPLAFALSVQNDASLPLDVRLRAAAQAAPYCHPRIDRVTQSKKDEAAKDAKDAGTGKFATPLPPKLIVNNR